jgi:hypothetical protein
MVMHRPIPADARIKEVVVIRERLAGRSRWSAVFTCRAPAPPLPVAAAGRCGIDLGWRLADGDLRVATIASCDGEVSHVLLPADWLAGMAHVDRIASERQEDAVAMMDVLMQLPWHSAPEPLRNAWTGVKSMEIIPRRLALLLPHWRAASDWQPAVRRDYIDWWADDHKRWIEQANLRQRLLRRREDMYLCAAKRIVEQHGIVVAEDIDWALFKRVTAQSLPRPIRHNQTLAAPGEFMRALERQAAKSGSVIKRHNGVSTRLCNGCGCEFAPSKPAELMYQCPQCSAVFDQDVNAARNLLAAADASAPRAVGTPGALAREMVSADASI